MSSVYLFIQAGTLVYGMDPLMLKVGLPTSNDSIWELPRRHFPYILGDSRSYQIGKLKPSYVPFKMLEKKDKLQSK